MPVSEVLARRTESRRRETRRKRSAVSDVIGRLRTRSACRGRRALPDSTTAVPIRVIREIRGHHLHPPRLPISSSSAFCAAGTIEVNIRSPPLTLTSSKPPPTSTFYLLLERRPTTSKSHSDATPTEIASCRSMRRTLSSAGTADVISFATSREVNCSKKMPSAM